MGDTERLELITSVELSPANCRVVPCGDVMRLSHSSFFINICIRLRCQESHGIEVLPDDFQLLVMQDVSEFVKKIVI